MRPRCTYAVVTTFVDITELRETGQQLKETAKHLADAMAGANVGTWELDLESDLAMRNARWAAILGHAPDEIEPTLAAFTDRIHPPTITCFKRPLQPPASRECG